MQNSMFQFLLYQDKTMQNYENNYVKVSKDLFVGANIPHKTDVGNPNENPKYIREMLGSSY